MRLVILDTETTGLNPKKGDRIVEVGCVEMVERKLTGRHYHEYINPERDIPAEVVAVHGIDNERVKDCPKFRDIAVGLWQWLEGADLVIHNAAFDMGFLNAEFERFAKEQGQTFVPLESACGVIDTLKIARDKHPGSKVSLDALCKRYGIDNSHRTLHGALLDSEILADVYLFLTGGQTDLMLGESETNANETAAIDLSVLDTQGQKPLVQVQPSAEELAAHKEFLAMISAKADKEVSW
ncbi:DNA polymerase III subunit epsilon [Reinekea thalattae]|uniref:DNA polymerase III subunit epsilon n=1 Tax=Reinekea thalattae TaxID=2593301 RepID=A0A5C8Z9N4_9GAMM|nr:DNA polymerase III subunit epsilon [Reinekea thalattae]TXR53576.1 DNA polymerase III subunit epsilon [Reinekea thalattae]